MSKIWRLLGPDNKPYTCTQPGTLGGHRRSRIYGRLDCPAALRAIARGGYVAHRVFFLTEEHAQAAGYRPCAVCLPMAYANWKASQDGDPESQARSSRKDKRNEECFPRQQKDTGSLTIIKTRKEKGIMKKQQLLAKLEKEWTAFNASYADLSEAQLTEPGVMGEWSVKDIIAHVSTWEEEALTYLPLILVGRKPPRYVQFGGLDAFNARMTEHKRSLALSEVLTQRDDTHQRLITYLQEIPEEHFTGETRFRHRLRLDTSSHYTLHTRAIQEWQREEAEANLLEHE